MAFQFNPFTGNFDSVGQPISALNLKGTVADVASLPAGATVGDVYQVQADLHFYVWDGAAWDDLGTLQGATGPAGADGADGANGVDGKTILNGSGAPSAGLGVDGDFYLDTTATAIYGPKTAGAWGAGTSLIGPTGQTGSAGADGADGADGRTVLSGAGSPSSGLGADGDFYIDTAASDLYGPKTAGAWGAGTSLVGPAGADGADGADGVGIPAGGTAGQVFTKSSGTDYDADWATPQARTTTAAGTLPATSYAAITYAASVALDLAVLDGQYRTISLTGDLTFTTSNLATGRTVVIRIIADASQRTLTFPADWKFLGTKPANIAASKTGVLSLTFFGTADSDCVAAWGVQG